MSDESATRTPVMFKLTKTDLANLEAIKDHIRPRLLGREPTRADAVRYAIEVAMGGLTSGGAPATAQPGPEKKRKKTPETD